jgi:hypothetical protein
MIYTQLPLTTSAHVESAMGKYVNVKVPKHAQYCGTQYLDPA